MQTDTEYEYWNSRASLVVTDPTGKDIALPDDESLEDAQIRKHDIAAEALQIQPDDKFIDSDLRNKRSAAINLATPQGAELIRRLAAEADILVENFKVGGLSKYGLDYASLKAINPRLVYCSITGFGQDGPYKTRAGYDLLVQGMGGIMDITGDANGEPTRLGVAFADVFTGVYSTLAVTAALKEREHTGKGSYIDMALMDTMVGVLANQATYYLVSGEAPKRMSNAHASVVPYQTFPTTDGWMLIACGNDGQFDTPGLGAVDIVEHATPRIVGDLHRNRELPPAGFHRRLIRRQVLVIHADPAHVNRIIISSAF